MTPSVTPDDLDWKRVEALIDMALTEDLGDVGDATSLAVIPAGMRAEAVLIAKEPCVCAGLDVAAAVFRKVDSAVDWTALAKDGDSLGVGDELARGAGPARSLLTAERTALNFLQRLSGVATEACRCVEAVKGTKTIILDTRKTTPGWRNLQKYAVRAGGATNHRVGLYDRIMIKDNHRALAGMAGPGGITRSVAAARKIFPDLEVEVEADRLEEVREAVEAGADYVLLDNMTDAEMAEAVALNAGRAKLEASGGVTIERLRAIAELGVDFISLGALTHSVKAADISMEILTK